MTGKWSNSIKKASLCLNTSAWRWLQEIVQTEPISLKWSPEMGLCCGFSQLRQIASWTDQKNQSSEGARTTSALPSGKTHWHSSSGHSSRGLLKWLTDRTDIESPLRVPSSVFHCRKTAHLKTSTVFKEACVNPLQLGSKLGTTLFQY